MFNKELKYRINQINDRQSTSDSTHLRDFLELRNRIISLERYLEIEYLNVPARSYHTKRVDSDH